MPYPIKDCDCEDFPCCGHGDNFPVEDPMDYYCDICGMCHTGECLDDRYDSEDEDEAALYYEVEGRSEPALELSFEY